VSVGRVGVTGISGVRARWLAVRVGLAGVSG